VTDKLPCPAVLRVGTREVRCQRTHDPVRRQHSMHKWAAPLRDGIGTMYIQWFELVRASTMERYEHEGRFSQGLYHLQQPFRGQP